MKHILTDELSHLARSIEHGFYRIERESRWASSLINGAIAGLAVGIIAWGFAEGEMLLFACLGSSAASVIFAPLSKNNSLRSIIMAYLLSALISLALFELEHITDVPMYFRCALAVGLSITLMRLLDAMHPAAVGGALAFILFDRDLESLLSMLVAILGLLALVKVFAYVYLEGLRFRNFGREFRRDYYGTEMQVTVTPTDEEVVATEKNGVATE